MVIYVTIALFSIPAVNALMIALTGLIESVDCGQCQRVDEALSVKGISLCLFFRFYVGTHVAND